MKKIFILCFLLLFTCVVWGQSKTDIVQPDATTIEFVVNTDKVIKNEQYFNFINNIVPFIREYSNRIENITFIGSASPEGNKKHNIYLANIRANKICSYISDYIPVSKITINNDYDLFLNKTGLSENDYAKLRATYIEITLKPQPKSSCPPIQPDIKIIRDTVYKTDTLYLEKELKVIPILALKTNMVSDLIATPNVQAELYTHLYGLSLEFEYTFPWYKIHDKFFYYQILNGAAGVRKYFNNTYTGHYVGLYGNTAIYDICLFNKDKGWQGELHGAGLTYGYVFVSKKYPRLKFECYVRLGWFNTKYDTYHTLEDFDDKYYYDWKGKNGDFVPRRFNMNYYGPTMIGFNITYDLLCLIKY